ncbi:MAG: radical SAM protein [Caldithrix sp.]|nr:radical SAM protein [Caldithrix sp.]
MPKILLINPWVYDFTSFDLWSKPLGLLYIGSFLRQFDFEIRYIDCVDKHAADPYISKHPKVKKYGTGHFVRTIVDKPAVLKQIPRHYARYGISEQYFIDQLKNEQDVQAVLVTSIMTYWYPGVEHVVRLVRKYLPGIPVILGGIYATLMPEHARRIIQPDYLVSGPGEWNVLRVLADILGLSLPSNNHPQLLDDYPYPAFDLINNPDYLIIMTARGCPYDCSFCAQKRISMPFTKRKPQEVVNEVTYHNKKYKVRDFAFYDDALFVDRERHIKPILRKLIDTQLPVRLHSPNGLFAKMIDEELARLMFKAGFKTIRLSFETSNEQRRKDMYSKVTNEAMIDAVKRLQLAGYKKHQLESYVLMGLPGQTMEEIVASIIFVHNLGVQVRLASFSPIPGTVEFERAVDTGKIRSDMDPLLTNKSIFPLKDKKITYEQFKKVRLFSQTLNQAAQRGLSIFGQEPVGTAVRSVIREM